VRRGMFPSPPFVPRLRGSLMKPPLFPSFFFSFPFPLFLSGNALPFAKIHWSPLTPLNFPPFFPPLLLFFFFLLPPFSTVAPAGECKGTRVPLLFPLPSLSFCTGETADDLSRHGSELFPLFFSGPPFFFPFLRLTQWNGALFFFFPRALVSWKEG